MTRNITIGIFIILIMCGNASAWYDGFDYRIPITIDNAENPALEDYQFNVSFSPGINETSARVINDTDYTIVPHWCENETGGLCYELWFNVSVGSEVNTDYYIYYGNDSISSTSDYDSTFTKKYNDSGLVLELHMDEGTGNSVAVDSSGEGNDGTLTNMNTTGNTISGWQSVDGGQWDNRSDVVFADGDHLRFDGVNDSVACGNGSSLNVPQTISLWVKNYENGRSQGLISKFNSVDPGWTIMHYANNKFVFRTKNGVIHNLFSNIAYVDTDWHHIAIVRNGGTNYMYVDSILQAATTTVWGSDVNENINVGLFASSHPTAYTCNSSIDEIRIYNRSLSEDEICRQYIRSKYAANTPIIGIGYTEKIPHPFLSGAYLFYGEMSAGLTGFRDGMGRYLIWGVVFFAVNLAFTLTAKIKHTLIGGK